MAPNIHLDHAATSHPKAPGVGAAVQRWFEDLGVSPDRGDSAACAEVARTFSRVRGGLATLCGVPPQRIALTSGATEALHLFFTASLRPGQRVVTTACAHSSVARPLRAAERQLGIDLEVVPTDADGRIDPGDVCKAVRREACDLVVLDHASNVTGVVQELAPCIEAAREAGGRVLVDASQTLGLVEVAGLGADAVVASAHKALLGPPGLGLLATCPDLDLPPPKPGGSGSSRALELHPEEWPTAFEAGTPNSPAVFGLAAALDWRDQQARPSASPIALESLRTLAERLVDRRIGIRLIAADSLQQPLRRRLPILSLTVDGWDPSELGILLDQAGFTVRSGFHCAPWIHRCLDTPVGTLRISPGPFVTREEILGVANALP